MQAIKRGQDNSKKLKISSFNLKKIKLIFIYFKLRFPHTVPVTKKTTLYNNSPQTHITKTLSISHFKTQSIKDTSINKLTQFRYFFICDPNCPFSNYNKLRFTVFMMLWYTYLAVNKKKLVRTA